MRNKANTCALGFSLFPGHSHRTRHRNKLISKAWEKKGEDGGKEGRVWGRGNDSKKGGERWGGGGGESKKLKEGMDKTRKKGKSEGRKE